MHTAIKKFCSVCALAVMLALMAGITALPAFAAGEGAYLAEACPSYKNPISGQVEDAGGEDNAVLGQAMTESAVYEKALAEIDSEGNILLTVRMLLTDNIENPVFSEDGRLLEAELIQEDFENDSADYRMSISSLSSVIRCSMSVTAMGRDVIFYISLGDLQPGSGDFITALAPGSEPIAAERGDCGGEEAQPQAPAKENEEPAGIQEFDAEGRAVENEAAAAQSSEAGSGLTAAFIIAAVLLLGFCVWYFGFFRKKK